MLTTHYGSIWDELYQQKHSSTIEGKLQNTINTENTEELTEFECDFQLIIKNAVFKKVNNTFQTQILNDVWKINVNDKIFVPADKLRNIYLLSKDEYQKLFTESVTKTYKMTKEKFTTSTTKQSQ